VKKLGKSGVILVETLVVTIFVMTLFMIAYQNVVPNMGEYQKLTYYDDIDSVYASNLVKQLITRYANTKYIDTALQSQAYIKMNDCSNGNLYINGEYCVKLQEHLSITDDDHIFITEYDITKFKNLVRTDEYFDSGELSNFRDYINTVPKVESFYSKKQNTNIVGKYRLFITRTVTEADFSVTTRYSNIGIYTGEYQKYNMGEAITFNPGDGNKTFYVLKNSPSTDSTVTLILGTNLASSNVTFNNTYVAGIPNTALNMLKTKTNSWTNVPARSDSWTSGDGYTISYSGYRARLLNRNDIIEALGCKEDDKTCFDYTEAFGVDFNQTELSWLIGGLDNNTGYWVADSVPKSNEYAWSIRKGRIVPVLYEDATTGIRPVITIQKDKLG